MANKIYDEEINKNIDWGGDDATQGLPVSGRRVQEFIKNSLNQKMGIMYYDLTNNRYLVFADTESRDSYLEDPTQTDLVLGTFDAPFNYTAEINLLSQTYNVIPIGSVGNYIEFTFDVKNKQNVSTGENVLVTYTFIRNSIKKVVTEQHAYGETVRFNIDSYLGDGINTVIIGITGQSTLAATTLATTYQVVNLSLTDETDISKVYNLTSGSSTIDIPFTVAGYGTKRVEWFIDGQLLDFVKEDDEVVDTEVSRVKSITLSNLQHGKHSLQLRAYTTINGDKFYTDTLYRDIFVNTGASEDTILGVAVSIPSKYGIVENGSVPTIYDIQQYVPYTLRVAAYSPIGEQSVVNVYLGAESKGSITLNNEEEGSVTLISTQSGNKTIKLTVNDIEYILPTVISQASINIGEITNSLEFDFSAVGRSNSSSDKDIWSYGEYTGTLTGFKWNDTSGWVNDRLLMSEDSEFSINYAPLEGSPTSTGKTFEIEFSTYDVKNDDAVICDLRDSTGTGILITGTKVQMVSAGKVTVETQFKSGENVRIAFVINRSRSSNNKCLSFIYTNGILSRAAKWLESDSYRSSETLRFMSTSEAKVSLKSIRVYNAALTSDQILNNFILYRDTLPEMLEIYNRNDIYVDGTTQFSPDKMMSRLPVMIVTGDIPILENTSSKDTQIVVDIDYYNMQDPTRNFRMTSAAMRPQGTSSMGYPKKNFRIYTQKVDDTVLYDANGHVVVDKLYAFRDGSQPVNCWCLKADFAESSGTHNTGIARLWNKALKDVQLDGQYVCRTNAQKAALASGYEYDVRTAIDGFPILLFYRPSVNDDLIFIGKYNFNNDKSTESVFGFKDVPGFDNTNMQCWEVLNNGNSIALFQNTNDFDNSWQEAFESRYPDTKTPDTTALKAFCEWMSTVTQEDFATQKYEHLNLNMMAAYYVYLMRYAAVDQFVKNAMFTSEDGQHFYYIHYDNDTINGLINSGKLIVKPDATRESKDETGAYIFAGHDSRLWNMLEADTEFMNLVRRMDNALYSAGISYLNSVKTFDEDQADKWVERVYNQDAQYKYIGPYSEKNIDNLFMLQGKRDLHRKWWLAKRFSIYDSKFVTGPFKSQSVEFKCINNTPDGFSFNITSGYPLYYGYGVNDNPRVTGVYLKKGQSHTFSIEEVLNIGDPVRIYGAANISAIDLSNIMHYLSQISIENVYDESIGTNLETLIVGTSGEINNAVQSISGLKQAIKLKYLDVRGLQALTSLDLSNQIYFEELSATNSGLTSIIFAKGAPVKKLSLPLSITNLTLEQLPMLKSNNIVFENNTMSQIKNIVIRKCPNISNNFDFIYNWFKYKSAASSECSLEVDNINWEDIDVNKLIELGQLRELKLKGVIKVDAITSQQFTQLKDLFGPNIFRPTSELYIIAPPSVYIIGPSEVIEGSTQQYECLAVGEEVERTTFSISSGGSADITIDSSTGLLTIKEGVAPANITIRVVALTSTTSIINSLNVSIIARTYPTAGTTSILGLDRLSEEEVTYILKHTSSFTGEYSVEWSLTGLDTYAEIKESDNTSCVVKRLKDSIELVEGSITATFKKVYNNSTASTISKNIDILNDIYAETDPVVCKIFYDAGLCANETYITKAEARVVTDEQFSALKPKFNQIQQEYNFIGFQHFISVSVIPKRMFCGSSYNTLNKIVFPPSIRTVYCGFAQNIVDITFNEGIETFEGSGDSTVIFSFRGGSSHHITRYLRLPDKLPKTSYYIPLQDSGSFIHYTQIEGGKDIGVPIRLNNDSGFRIRYSDISIVNSNLYYIGGNGFIKDPNYLCSELPTKIQAPKGGYFSNRNVEEDIILEELKNHVYEIKNKIEYITVNIKTNVDRAQFTVSTPLETVTSPPGEVVIKAKYSYPLTVQGSSVDNYITPSKYHTDAIFNAYTDVILIYYPDYDVYIQHIDGTLYTKEEWTSNNFNNEQANGVALSNSEVGFVVSKDQSSSKLAWGGYNKTITDIVTTTSQSEAVLDNNGAGNTPKIIEQCSGYTSNGITGAPAAEYCANYVFPNGKTGYLGALGEWKALYDNKAKVKELMTLIGGTAISDGNYWTSTQHSSYYSWYLYWNYDSLNYYSKYNTYSTRAFCLLS